ncbi:MAG: helix-hairpin-helix domain-containing protein, partial [Clostridia bacterium]|nr:helix-hairpin-helix domain-containing protein [Clostridia bacterium]
GVDLPLFGLVKDDRHKTRALTDGVCDVGILKEQDVYMFLYQLQEEVHRHTVSATMGAKTRSVKRSSLEAIPGIGKERAKLLLSAFGKLTALKEAGPEELLKVKGITRANAFAIYDYFHRKDENQGK